MVALELLVQETQEQILWSFLGRCPSKERMGQAKCWVQGITSYCEECRAERGCHLDVNSPKRRTVNSTAPPG